MRNHYILYDGECPFCSAYVRMQRLRAAGVDLSLLDAREHPELVQQHLNEGRDVNQGMILKLDDSVYFGADVMNMIALMTGPTSFLNRLVSLVFKRHWLARILYPTLRVGRNFALRLLGRRKIEHPDM